MEVNGLRVQDKKLLFEVGHSEVGGPDNVPEEVDQTRRKGARSEQCRFDAGSPPGQQLCQTEEVVTARRQLRGGQIKRKRFLPTLCDVGSSAYRKRFSSHELDTPGVQLTHISVC